MACTDSSDGTCVFQAQLLEDRQKQLDDVNKLHESEIEALRETHAAEMADVNANHQTQIDKMKEIQSLSAINANGHDDHDQSDMEQLKVSIVKHAWYYKQRTFLPGTRVIREHKAEH